MKDHKKEKHDNITEEIKSEGEVAGADTEQTNATASEKDHEGEKGHDKHKHKEENAEKIFNEKLAAVNDKYIRLVAEFDNYRRRTAKERLDLVLTASEETIKGILPVLDDFERALEMFRNAEGDNSVAIEGTELICNKLFSYLSSKGLKVIEAKGMELDTDFHEAIAQLPAPDKKLKNKIIEVVQQGYTLNSKVIRFAKVVVGI
ncbi:MAG TPA: nucleotide exchange factor GrpE [Bacteroidales bacterium]|nr:nucleotide exchange factor GrpE [Bacteroidales bacterium]